MRIKKHQVKDRSDWSCNFLHLLSHCHRLDHYFTGPHGGLVLRMRGTVDLAESGDRLLAARITRAHPCASNQEQEARREGSMASSWKSCLSYSPIVLLRVYCT